MLFFLTLCYHIHYTPKDNAHKKKVQVQEKKDDNEVWSIPLNELKSSV